MNKHLTIASYRGQCHTSKTPFIFALGQVDQSSSNVTANFVPKISGYLGRLVLMWQQSGTLLLMRDCSLTLTECNSYAHFAKII